MRATHSVAARVAAAAVAVLTIVCSVLMWWVVSFTADAGRAISEIGGSDAEVVSLVGEARDVIDGTVVSLSVLSELGANLESATGDTSDALADAGRLIEDDVASSLDSVQQAMPALIEAGDVIDTTLRTLSLFGVDYAPTVPFDDALAGVEDSLSGLPEDVRAQGAQVRALAPQVEALSVDTGEVVESLGQLERQLSDVGWTLARLEESSRGLTQVTGLLVTFDNRAPVVRTLIVVAALAGLSLSVALWRLGTPQAGSAVPADHHSIVHT